METRVAQQLEPEDLSVHLNSMAFEIRFDEGEAVGQGLNHLAESAVVAGSNVDSELGAGSGQGWLEAAVGAVRLRLHRARLHQKRDDTHHGGHCQD